MTFDIGSPGDIFDSREVIERIEELVAEIGDSSAPDDFVMEREELDKLYHFEMSVGNSEWGWGMTFIADDYFTDYAEGLVRDLGYLSSDVPEWIAIDWEKTAETILQDYTSYNVNGALYWARS